MFVIKLESTVPYYYIGKGKYRNSFSLSSSIEDAKLFTSKEAAEKIVKSDDFQYRLKSQNKTAEALGWELYKPQIKEI